MPRNPEVPTKGRVGDQHFMYLHVYAYVYMYLYISIQGQTHMHMSNVDYRYICLCVSTCKRICIHIMFVACVGECVCACPCVCGSVCNKHVYTLRDSDLQGERGRKRERGIRNIVREKEGERMKERTKERESEYVDTYAKPAELGTQMSFIVYQDISCSSQLQGGRSCHFRFLLNSPTEQSNKYHEARTSSEES